MKKDKKYIAVGLVFAAVLVGSACGNRESLFREEIGKNEKTVRKEGKEKKQKNDAAKAEMTKEELRETWVEECISHMTLEEKIAQMFVLPLDILSGVENTIEADSGIKKQFQLYPVGGVVMLGGNIQSEGQITALNTQLKAISQEQAGVIPFLCVDEEGGTVNRIAGNPNFPVQDVGDMSLIGATGDVSQAYQAGLQQGAYLSQYQFNVDFAPDADVFLNPDNTVVASRSFGSDAELVASMVTETIRGLNEGGVCATVKHFPGHGATSEDSHEGFAYSMRTPEEIKSCELKPFRAGIDAGADFVMVGHISYPNVTGDDTPATLSEILVNQFLRQELQYDGIVITDAMNMGAIVNHYGSGDATVMAVQAGIDMILMPADFQEAYQAVIENVKQGVLSEERIDDSVKRILKVKWKIQEEEETK